MTRDEAINILYGMRADNLNLDDAYTKDKYDALEMAIKALEQEPCENAINTKSAIEAFQMFREYESNRNNKEWVDRIETVLNQLPPVTPQTKTGHWIVVSDGYGDNAYICECSECKDTVWVYKDADRKWNYCPDCGARMERSDKE